MEKVVDALLPVGESVKDRIKRKLDLLQPGPAASTATVG